MCASNFVDAMQESRKLILLGRKPLCIFPINVTDHIEVLFPNLISYEVCKGFEINYVTCYLSLMSNLMETKKDVALLRCSKMESFNEVEELSARPKVAGIQAIPLTSETTTRKIMKNYIGSDAKVAHLFDGLCKEVTLPRKYVFEKLHNYVMEHY